MSKVDRKPGVRWREAVAQLRHLPRTVRLCREAAPGLTTAFALLLLLSGVLPVASVYATKLLVDAVVAGRGVSTIATAVSLLGAAMLLAEVLRSATVYVRTAQAERVRDHLAGLIQERSVAADLAFYETPEYFDHLHRAREEARHRPLMLLESVGGLLQNGITLVAMAVVLIPFGLLMPMALLLSTIPALEVVLAHTVRFHRWRRLRTADERRALYFDWLLSRGEAAAEVRVFALGEELRRRYGEIRGRLREERIALARRQAWAEALAGAAGLLVSAGAFAFVALRAARGVLTLGDLALFWQAFYTGQRLLRGLLADVGQIYGNVLFLGDLFEFLALRPGIVDPADPLSPPDRLTGGVTFRGVTFRYPGAAKPVFADFNLSIRAGQVTALVGENGSGKSTLVKLLCRLYDPDGGAVSFDGEDLRRFPVTELRRRISVLFQEPVHYFVTAGENVAFGDLPAAPVAADLAEAARAAGAEEILASLPHGPDTLLGTWFRDGTELSVGEWQRLALARAFLRRSPVLVLDEPTSSMDPWAEAEWLGEFRERVRGRTVLLITHRFSTARHADAIHVMEAGRIVESGTHEELLAAGGRYAGSWRAQTQ